MRPLSRRWLVIAPPCFSLDELLSDRTPGTSTITLVRYSSSATTVPPVSAAGAVTNAAELQEVFASTPAEHTLFIHRIAEPRAPAVSQISGSDFGASCLLEAYQAHRASGHQSRISLITFGTHPCGSNELEYRQLPQTLAILGVSKTLFMEDRAAFGPCLDLPWPQAPQPFQVPPPSLQSMH